MGFRAGLALTVFALGFSAAGFADSEIRRSFPGSLQKSLRDEKALVGAGPRPAGTGGCPDGWADCRRAPESLDREKFFPSSPQTTALGVSIRSVKPRDGEKIIALTFDLCQTAAKPGGYDAAIVDYLRQNDVRASFFAGGLWLRSHREKALQLLADPRFEIGSHGWSHRNMRRLTLADAEREVAWVQVQYAELLGELKRRASLAEAPMPEVAPPVPLIFRFPYGVCSRENLRLLQKLKLPAVQWSIVTGDPAPGQTAPAIAQAVLRQARPGAIIVAHANGNGRHTAEALPLFVPELRRQGYRFVTVSELLRSAERVESAPSCYELKPGDNRRYDKLGP